MICSPYRSDHALPFASLARQTKKCKARVLVLQVERIQISDQLPKEDNPCCCKKNGKLHATSSLRLSSATTGFHSCYQKEWYIDNNSYNSTFSVSEYKVWGGI